MLLTVLFVAVCCVAFTNGANANFKGVASLYGSGTTSLRVAAGWGTATTLAGSIASTFLMAGMVQAFGGKGVVSDALAASPQFLTAVALGTAATSFLATRCGFPVSTTHAIVGALVGAGLAGSGDVRFASLGKLIVYPLLFSPLVAAILGAIVYCILRLLRLAPEHRSRPLDIVHFLSAGAASFARGLNDTPKIVAPMLAVPSLQSHEAFIVVAIAMALGGLLDVRNVAETLGKKVTDMSPGQGMSACLVTASLVTTASMHTMPVSTTHVSVGSLFGMGAMAGKAHWRKVGEITLAWCCTVPCGAALAALAYSMLINLR